MATESLLPQTTQAFEGPRVRQFSIFLKNKVGALLDVVRMLNAHDVQVLALSIQDSSDSAIVRCVVSDPDQVEELFREHDIPFSVSEMVVVELKEVATDLGKVLTSLLSAEVNIFFSYPLMTRPRGRAVLALHVEDHECASAALAGNGFRLLSQADISR